MSVCVCVCKNVKVCKNVLHLQYHYRSGKSVLMSLFWFKKRKKSVFAHHDSLFFIFVNVLMTFKKNSSPNMSWTPPRNQNFDITWRGLRHNLHGNKRGGMETTRPPFFWKTKLIHCIISLQASKLRRWTASERNPSFLFVQWERALMQVDGEEKVKV